MTNGTKSDGEQRMLRMVYGASIMVALLVGVSAQDAVSGCDSVALMLANFPTLAVNRLEGEVRDYRTGKVGRGCRVEMKGSASAFRESGAPDIAIRERFAGLGWSEDYEYAADGPDGSAFAFRHGSVLCVFRAHWNGGDDSDPSYVPDDRYDMEVDCLVEGAGRD